MRHPTFAGWRTDKRACECQARRGRGRQAVEAMDEAWKRRGLESRTELFLCALRAYLQGAGENEVAARV